MANTFKHSRLILLALAALTVGCAESFDPSAPAAVPSGGLHALVVSGGVASDITLDQVEAALNIGIGYNGGTHVGKEFDANPQPGDAIVATFVWRGTTNTITEVTDHLEDGTPVGNSYTLADYTTANGWSVATYVATNVGNYPYPSPNPNKNLAVHAIFSDVITDGGEMITAYRGVSPVAAVALGAHSGASGTGSTTTVADPGTIAVNPGALAYSFTMSDAIADLAGPANFNPITAVWNTTNKIQGEYTVTSAAGTVDPLWTWSFSAPSNWYADVVALNPQVATHLAFKVQPTSTMLPGQTITPAVQVAVLDDQGNAVTGFNGTVTMALGHDASPLGNARLSGTLTVNVVNGVATFNDLSVDEVGMGFTLKASASNLTGSTSAAFNVTL